MGSWSNFFKGSAKEGAEPASPAAAEPVMQAASTGRRAEIVTALRCHLQTVWETNRKSFDVSEFNENDDLYDSGYVDSLSAPQFLLLAEKQYGVKLPDWLLGGQAKSVAALAEYIERQLTGGKS